MINVPLARLLTRFPGPDIALPTITPHDPDPEPDPAIVLVAAQIDTARREIESQCAAQLAELRLAHTEAVATAIAETRAAWCAMEGPLVAQRIDDAFARLRASLSDQLADVLRPLLGEAVTHRTRDALIATLDLILADSDHPPLTLKGPGDLIDAVRSARPDARGIDYVAHDEIDAIVTADGLRIETRLEAALSTLAQAEN